MHWPFTVPRRSRESVRRAEDSWIQAVVYLLALYGGALLLAVGLLLLLLWPVMLLGDWLVAAAGLSGDWWSFWRLPGALFAVVLAGGLCRWLAERWERWRD